MELSSSDKERIQHQYDALAKKTLVGEAKSHRRTLAKRAAREVTFSDLSESELVPIIKRISRKVKTPFIKPYKLTVSLMQRLIRAKMIQIGNNISFSINFKIIMISPFLHQANWGIS